MSTIAGREGYRKWLTSEFWRNLRILTLACHQLKCDGCGVIDKNNHVHHMVYKKRWEDTKIWHLRVLCRNCHKLIHEVTTPSEYKKDRQGIQAYEDQIKIIRLSKGLPAGRRGEHGMAKIRKKFIEDYVHGQIEVQSGTTFVDSEFYQRNRQKKNLYRQLDNALKCLLS